MLSVKIKQQDLLSDSKNIFDSIDLSQIISVLFKCLPRPRLSVLHVPLIISGLENTRDLIEINLKKDNCFC